MDELPELKKHALESPASTPLKWSCKHFKSAGKINLLSLFILVAPINPCLRVYLSDTNRENAVVRRLKYNDTEPESVDLYWI